MANADINVTFTLTLTEDEVYALRDVLSHIAGFPGSRRDHTDRIAVALDEIGVDFSELADDIDGSIIFIRTEDSNG